MPNQINNIKIDLDIYLFKFLPPCLFKFRSQAFRCLDEASYMDNVDNMFEIEDNMNRLGARSRAPFDALRHQIESDREDDQCAERIESSESSNR